MAHIQVVPVTASEYRAERLREELQALEKYLYSQTQTQAWIDALFSFGYIQAELLAVADGYDKQVKEQGNG